MPQRPLREAALMQRGQAVVVEPAMLFYSNFERRDHGPSCARLVPLPSWLLDSAARGKVHYDGVRGAFCWHCPRFGPLGAAVGEALWALWLHFRPHADHRVGLIVEAQTGVLLGMQQFVAVCRDALLPIVADRSDADMFTSYSLRRFAPTLCDVRGAPWHKRLAMGGWREQPADQQQRQQARNLMPA
eukprot:6207624-Amphidinium_carterae.1